MERKCKNCLLFDNNNGLCKVAILNNGEMIHLPVFPEDDCHMDALGIPVQQVRWWVENPDSNGNGVVKMEYPIDFLGNIGN